jgi:hypothetical protein
MDTELSIAGFEDWLHSTSQYVGVKPIDCKMRALNILIDYGATDTELDSLFKITRIPEFSLAIPAVFECGTLIEDLWLGELGPRIEHAVKLHGRGDCG